MSKIKRVLPAMLFLLGLATAGCASDPPASQPMEPIQPVGTTQPVPLAIELDRPVPGQHIREPLPIAQVSGRAGTLPFFASDVVILIDQSALALLASGLDVDEDGVVGRTRSTVKSWEPLSPPDRLSSTDLGDTNQALQLRVTRDLIPRLADRQNRVGLASFNFRARSGGSSVVRLTGKPEFIVPVGEPDAVLEALEEYPAAQGRRWTDLTRLLETGAELLDDATPIGEPARPRAMLLLSLGVPSAPTGVGWSSRKAAEQSRELGERGVALWVVPLVTADPAFMIALTRDSGGEVIALNQLDAQFGVPALTHLAPRELEIENITNHEGATRLRTFPDGRFDALVLLEPGANTLEIRAVLADGRHETIRRVVHYEASRAE